MVEFGLKLEDNKVAEWASHYIRYEQLKQILKKAKQANSRYEELAKKRPQQAAMLKDRFTQGLPTPLPSTDGLNLMDSQRSKSNFEMENVSSHSGRPSNYGSTEATPVHHSESSNSLVRAFHQAASGVTDYFKQGYDRQVYDALKEIKKNSLAFEECLIADIESVNNFYNRQLEELTSRFEFLKDAVVEKHSKTAIPPGIEPPDRPEDEDEFLLSTPLAGVRKKTPLSNFISKIKGHRRNESSTGEIAFSEEDDVNYREAESIQRALVDQYRNAKLLHNFAIMNYTGFVKIVKKHDKTIEDDKGRYKEATKSKNICNEGTAVEEFTNTVERVYANWFCEKNISEARAQLLPKKGDSLEMDWSQLRLGYRMGMCSILGIWVCWDCIWGLYQSGRSTIGGRTAFPVFRACGGILLLQWFWGMSVWVWSRYRVNYIYLFDLDPRNVRSPLAIFNEAVDNTLVFLISALLYYKAGAHDIPGKFPAGFIPFLLVLYTIYHLIFPIHLRGPMWKSVWLVVTTPATSPSFFHGYIGDIFTSMVKVFQDLVWTAFFLITGDFLISEDSKRSAYHPWSKTRWYGSILIPLVTLLPLWFRFNQCLRKYADTGNRFPHLANAFKYAMSQTVTLFGAFHPLYMDVSRKESDVFQIFWTFAFITSSLYSFVWDVYMDWGLGRRKYGFLASPLMYPNRWFYFIVIAIDLILRFAWVLTLVPPQSGANFGLPAYLTALSMLLELFRRTLWGFLRLENEHRTNASGHRRVGFVPLHFSTGHTHEYKKEKERSGFAVLLEIAVVTIIVVGACVVAVVAAQQATEKASSQFGDL